MPGWQIFAIRFNLRAPTGRHKCLGKNIPPLLFFIYSTSATRSQICHFWVYYSNFFCDRLTRVCTSVWLSDKGTYKG